MPRRRIGREELFSAPLKRSFLDEVDGLIDWSSIETRLEVIHSAPRGEAGWPPQAMFRALRLAIWHDLSDVKLAEALDDRASSAGSAAFPAASPRPSAPPSSASARNSFAVLSTGFCSSRSRRRSRQGRCG
jgi:IS5 family transposase